MLAFIFAAAMYIAVSDIDRVNQDVNTHMRPVSDRQHYGVDDKWVAEPADGKGDCEDFALTKRARLMRLGVRPEDMKVAIVRTPRGLHAVLEVSVQVDGYPVTYVLDNLDKRTLPLTEAFLTHHYKTLVASDLLAFPAPATLSEEKQ